MIKGFKKLIINICTLLIIMLLVIMVLLFMDTFGTTAGSIGLKDYILGVFDFGYTPEMNVLLIEGIFLIVCFLLSIGVALWKFADIKKNLITGEKKKSKKQSISKDEKDFLEIDAQYDTINSYRATKKDAEK